MLHQRRLPHLHSQQPRQRLLRHRLPHRIQLQQGRQQQVIVDETLWKKIVKAYEKGDFEEGYAIRALVEKHMGSCTVDVTGTLQSDGTYKVTHTFTMR